MSEPYVGQIMVFAFNFAPVNYAFANGALIAISQNEALFALLGTTYGGNGQTTFGLPNLQDSTAMSIGQGSGLSNYDLGQVSGITDVTLITSQLPSHTHNVIGQNAATTADFTLTPTNNGWFGVRGQPSHLFASAPNTTLAASALAASGGGLPHPNEQPYLGMNFCIALYGIFPSRN